MKTEFEKKRTPTRIRMAADTDGNQYELQEWRELVRVLANGAWSPWEPFNRHGEAMTCKGVELERISSLQWSFGNPPVVLTLLE